MNTTGHFKVILPVEIGGEQHAYGAVVALDAETAAEYSHALLACDEKGEVTDGRDS